MDRDFDYENNNVEYDHQENGPGIRCKNYIVCGEILPTWWFECKECYLCTNCHMMFGTWKSGEYNHIGKGILEVSDNVECPICLEIKMCITQPRCEHSVCIDCFKRCYYRVDLSPNEIPVFPYPDMEDEYDEDQDDPKWNNDYPLIKIYNEEYNKLLDDIDEQYENEAYLRNCPLCRK